MSPELSLFVRSLGMALLHSIWQGAAIAAGLWAIFRLMPQVTARIKYHFSVAGLLFLFAWFATTWAQQYDRLQVARVTVTEAASATHPARTYTIGAPAVAQSSYFPQFRLPDPDPALPWFMALYATGLVIMLVRFGYSISTIYRLRRSYNAFPAAGQRDWVQGLCEKMGIEKEVLVRFSKNISVPVVTGFIKPVILLPVMSVNQLSQDQLEAILLHELAHIKRNDYLVNIAQAIIETVLFFNPFMWRISAVIRREREHCCDDLVVIHSSHRLPYAMALATLETQRGNRHHMALAASGKKQHLFNRIKRIMEMKKESLNYGRLVAVVLLVTAIGVSAVWLTPGFAQTRKNEKAEAKKKAVAWFSEETLTVKDNNGHEKTYNNLEEWPEQERLKMAQEYARKGTELYFGNNYRQLRLNDDGKTTSIVTPKANPFPAPAPVAPPPPAAIAATPPPPPPPYTAPPAPPAPEMIADEPADIPDFPITAADCKKISKEVHKAMKQVDWNQVNREIADATKDVENINWEEVQQQVSAGLKQAQAELNKPEVRREIRQSMTIARREIARGMDEARRAMNEARESGRQAEDESRRAMEEERAEQRRNRAEQRSEQAAQRRIIREQVRISGNAAISAPPAPHKGSYDRMLDKMNEEGLIDREDGFKIEKKGDRLYINGEEQDDNVYNKYKPYLKGEKIKIKGGKNNLSISVTN